MSREIREGVLLIFQAIEDLKKIAEEPEEQDEPKEALTTQVIELCYSQITSALGKLRLFKDDRVKIMDILDKVKKGEDATPPEQPQADNTELLPRGTITVIFHNGTRRHYEAVILGEAEKT